MRILKVMSFCTFKDPHTLDILDIHGNYQAAKNIKKSIIYICKENNILAEGIDVSAFVKKNIEQVFEELQYLNTMREKLVFLFERGFNPSAIINNGSLELKSYILDNFDKVNRLYNIFQVTVNQKVSIPLDQIKKIPEEVLEWNKNKETLILAGPTGIGKTTLAKALLPTGLLVRHLDKLKELSTLNNGFIIDDVDLKNKLSREETINLFDLDHDTQVNVKHSFVNIPAGTPRIVTTNHFSLDLLVPHDEYGAIKRRVKFIYYKSAPKSDLKND